MAAIEPSAVALIGVPVGAALVGEHVAQQDLVGGKGPPREIALRVLPCALGRKPELLRGFLLQRAGDERRRGLACGKRIEPGDRIVRAKIPNGCHQNGMQDRQQTKESAQHVLAFRDPSHGLHVDGMQCEDRPGQPGSWDPDPGKHAPQQQRAGRVAHAPEAGRVPVEDQVGARQGAVVHDQVVLGAAAEPDLGRVQALADVAKYLKGNKDAKIQVQGNCDERGTSEYNMALGDRRADSARKYLVSLGVPAGALSTISFGKEKPLDPGHTEEAWAKNRRAHFVLRSSACQPSRPEGKSARCTDSSLDPGSTSHSSSAVTGR